MSVATVVELHSQVAVHRWDELAPGPELGARLASVELGGLSDDELLDVMAAWRRQTAWANAGELGAAAELVRRRDVEYAGVDDRVAVGEFVADEVCLALTVTGHAAGALLSLAMALTERLPRTWNALRRGRIDVARARVIADALLGVDAEVTALVDELIFPEAEELTTGRLRHRVRQAIITVDPGAALARTQRAVKGRRVELGHTPAGTCDLIGRDLPAHDADAAYNRINAAAQAMHADGDGRGIDAIRADLFSALLRGIALPDATRDLAAASPDPNGPANPPTPSSEASGDGAVGGRFDPAPRAADRKHRTPDTDAIAALTDEVAATIAGLVHAHLTTATQGRGRGAALAANTTAAALAHSLTDLKTRWCTAINGHVPNTSGGHGHDGYRPPAAMRRLIQNDYGRCAFPTCRRNATRCDLDHTQPWDKTGPTCWCNLAPLCRHHHRLKQEPEWTLLQPWPGILVWITPTGKWHLITPDDRE